MESESYFDARTCYEDGLQLGPGADNADSHAALFSERIDAANRKLAERNLYEAESAWSRGDADKAVDHLELVKTLTYDPVLREKAEKLLLDYSGPDDDPGERMPVSSCGSCAGSSAGDSADSGDSHDSLPLLEYYELLIHQLPDDEYLRYAVLGEKFAYAYIAASRDLHDEALSGFENCIDALPPDIYRYEKGKVLHRLGNDREAEQNLRSAIDLNGGNSLAWVALALLLLENHRFQDALTTVEAMIAGNIMTEQALMLRADIYEATGDHEAAINQYVELLQTPYVRAAAEKLYGLLLDCGRQSDAAVIFKKYMNKSCH